MENKRIKVIFGEDESDNLRQVLVNTYEFEKSEKRSFFPGIAKFASSDNFLSDLEKETLEIVTSSVKTFDIKSEVEAHIIDEKNPFTAAMYHVTESTPEKAVFSLPAVCLFRAFYSEEDVDPTTSLTDMQMFMDHEMRHHLDLSFLKSKGGLKPLGKDTLGLEEYILRLAYRARIEGFASFVSSSYTAEELKNYLEGHTKTVSKVLKELAKHNPISKDTLGDTLVRFLMDNGCLVGELRAPHWWMGFSEYIQGPDILHVFEIARKKELGIDINHPVWTPGEVYVKLLHEISKMPLREFYERFYENISSLGLNKRYAIFPRKELMKMLKEHATDFNHGRNR